MNRSSLRAPLFAAILLPFMLAGCAASGGASGGRPSGPLAANPSAYVTADLAFSRLVQEKGQAAAFRDMALPDAVVITDHIISARDSVRQSAGDVPPMRWQPHGVYSSCDGNIALTYGTWQGGGKQGRYQRLWLRDARGEMRWRADWRAETAEAAEAPEYIATKSATCRPRAPAPDGAVVATGPAAKRGDLRPAHSLTWSVKDGADGRKYLMISLWDGEKFVAVTGDGTER